MEADDRRRGGSPTLSMKAPIDEVLSPRTSPSLSLVAGFLNYTHNYNNNGMIIGGFY